MTFFKCLADETRLKCLLLTAIESELCVCELMAALAEIQPKISRHLSQLRNCEILLDRRQGQWVFYHINPNLPAWARQVIDTAAENNRPFLKQCLANLKQMRQRPSRDVICG